MRPSERLTRKCPRFLNSSAAFYTRWPAAGEGHSPLDVRFLAKGPRLPVGPATVTGGAETASKCWGSGEEGRDEETVRERKRKERRTQLLPQTWMSFCGENGKKQKVKTTHITLRSFPWKL